MSFDPYDMDNHFDDYVLWQAQLQQMEIDQRIQNKNAQIQAQQEKIKKIRFESAERDKKYAEEDLERYLSKLTPRRQSELEALLSRLNIILPASDSTESEVPDVEAAAVDADAERDLEQYLSKLTSDKREELESIINSYKQTSAALDELQKVSNPQPARKQVTPKQAIIAWGIIISVFVICYVINHI